MKALELTKECKEKLLEMSIKLFQDGKNCNHIEILQNNNIKLYKNYSSRIYKRFYSLKGTVSIHWYEFCLTHLSKTLEKTLPMRKEDGNLMFQYNLNECVLMSKQNPIDYLYEQFKKINISSNKRE